MKKKSKLAATRESGVDAKQNEGLVQSETRTCCLEEATMC